VSNESLVIGQGDAYSSEREVQAEDILDFADRIEETGLADFVPHSLPMFSRHTRAEAKAWILSKPRNYNFTLAAQASNSHVTRLMDTDGRKEYAEYRFAESNQARRELEWRSPVDKKGNKTRHGCCPTRLGRIQGTSDGAVLSSV
jgi:hypothetical protein